MGFLRTRGKLRPSKVGRCFPFLAVALALASPAMADFWYEHYDRATKAIEAEEWTRAVEEINLALGKRGDSSARARTYGMSFTAYFPYLKLGVAYYHLGELDAALQALETEERLGAIVESEGDHAELQRLRDRIRGARESLAADQERRTREIVAEKLQRAAALEREGDLDAAMVAVGEALAVAPDDPQAHERMQRLRAQLARQQSERELEQRVAKLIAEANSRLEAKQYQEASTLFDRALALKPSDDMRAMRDRASAELRKEVETRDAARLERMIADGLRQALDAESKGDLLGALTRIQGVLALDPAHVEAVGLQQRAHRLLAAADREQAQRETIRGLEAELEGRFAAEDYEGLLSASNRLLALDAENGVARRYIAEAYSQINATLLGARTIQNFPPAIRFADFREAHLRDGLQVQRVTHPRFRLTGAIFDDAPVDLVCEVASSRGAEADTRAEGTYRAIEGRTSSQQVGTSTISEFSLSHVLPPGLSVFRIVATDPSGLTSTSEYAVFYRRPLHRAPWFYVVLAVMLLGAVGGLFARRLYRRNRLRKRRFNPFVAGAPVLDPEMFFGRDPLIDRVLQTIHNNSLLLFGERRIGKTSLLHRLKQRLDDLRDPKYDFYSVYIDLQGTPENKFFSTLADDIFEGLAPILDGLQPSAALADPASYSYRDFVRDLREVLKVLRRQSPEGKKVKLVLLIDEVDALNEYDPRVNQKLRSLFMKSFADSLVAVVSGVGIKKEWESEGSPWYNFFEEIEVKPLSPRDAEALIRRPVGDVFRLEREAVERILALTDCKPYLIQKLCISLVNRLHQERRRTITSDDVDRVARMEQS